MTAALVAVSALTGVAASVYSTQRTEIAATQSSQQISVDLEHAKNPQKTVKKSTTNNGYAGRTHRLKADRHGHFIARARMNGAYVEVLVDTGATSVAINKSTARRLGIHLKASDLKYRVNTANGVTMAASAIIDRIEIGRVGAENVQAAVLPDKSLNGTLLGMSFLKEMRSFEIRNGELLISQ
ncbi:MAG: TIGR02281 family clan AA aspartic protease [Pseudomonadota bacterium]